LLLPQRQGIQALLPRGGGSARLAGQFLGLALRGEPFPFLAPGGRRVPELPGRTRPASAGTLAGDRSARNRR